jgi:8-oxo-dGTP diphosphatase
VARAFYFKVLERCLNDSDFRRHMFQEAWLELKRRLPGWLTPRREYIYCRESNPLVPGGRWLAPQSLSWRPAAYGLLFDEQERVLMVRNNSLNFYWNFPGGALSRGETQQEALVREFDEETGLQVEVGPIIDSWDDFIIMPTGQPVHGLLHYYLVRAVGGKLLRQGNNFDVSEAAFFETYFEPDKTEDQLNPPSLRLKKLIEQARRLRHTLNYNCGLQPEFL